IQYALVNIFEIAAPTRLRLNPSAGFQRSSQASKESVVILHPVERSSAEDAVALRLDPQVSKVGMNESDASIEARLEGFLRLLQHVLRHVHCQHVPLRQPLQ